MWNTVLAALGLVLSAAYVGYLAYAIGALPLWVIVVATFILAIYDFALDARSEEGRTETAPERSKLD